MKKILDLALIRIVLENMKQGKSMTDNFTVERVKKEYKIIVNEIKRDWKNAKS